jgi:cytochrome P450
MGDVGTAWRDVDSSPPTIDLLSAASFADGQPHDQFRWLRQHDPVHWHEEPGGSGFWAVTRYRDVKFIGRTPEIFSSQPTILIPDGGFSDPDHQMFLTTDPPAHTAKRRLISSRFIPRAARALRPRIRELATAIVDGVIERGECDLADEVAGLMPSYVLADLLGIPLEDGVALYPLTEAIHAAPGSQPPEAAMNAVMTMFDYAHQVWEQKRAQPSDDIASMIVNGEIDGVPIDETDFNLYFILLVDAGGDTTRNLVTGGIHALLEHPDEMSRLRADVDGVLTSGIEEMLRWVSPVVYMRRSAKEAVRVGDQEIGAGDKIVMYYGAANRDPEAFDDPERFDLTRKPNEHVAFGGGGPHFCLGAHIARIEIEELLREVLTRMEGLELAGDPVWLESNFISGLKNMPVRFRPGPRPA